MALIQATEQLIGNFLSDPGAALKPVILQLQAEASFTPVLQSALQEFGWQGTSFSSAIDLRALSSRLRAMLYSGLEQKGQGSFSIVFKVFLLSSPPKLLMSGLVPVIWWLTYRGGLCTEF